MEGYDSIDPGPRRPSLGERYAEMWRRNYENSPSLAGALAALGREAIKDVRQTLNEFFFGRGEHAPEPGTPLNPTQQIVTQEQGNFHGYEAALEQAAQRGNSMHRGNDQDHGHGH